MGSVDDWTPDPVTGKRRYRARWRSPSGRTQSKVFPTKREAKAHVAKMETDRNAGTYFDLRKAREPFEAVAERWRKMQPHRASTARSVEAGLRVHTYPTLGDRPIGAITTSEVQAWVTKLGQTLGPGTVELVYGRASSVFAAAVLDRAIPFTPCVRIKLPRLDRAIEDVLETGQVLAIADKIVDRYRALVMTGAGTGVRPGELIGLPVSAIDFLRREIHVRQQLTYRKGGMVLTGVLKTAESRRTIPVAQQTLDILAAHIAERPPAVVESVTGEGEVDRRLVFTSSKGAISQTHLRGVWTKARTAANAPDWATPHDLRHYYASLLIAQKIDVKTVQKRLGHAKATTTLDTYAKLWPDTEDETRTAVAAHLFPDASPVRHRAGS